MTREQQVLLDELEQELDANLMHFGVSGDEQCHFSLMLPTWQMTARMRQVLAKRYEDAGWSQVRFEEISNSELLFVLYPPARRNRSQLDGSWFGRSGPPPPPVPWWHHRIHQAIPLLLVAGVTVLWMVARLYSAGSAR